MLETTTRKPTSKTKTITPRPSRKLVKACLDTKPHSRLITAAQDFREDIHPHTCAYSHDLAKDKTRAFYVAIHRKILKELADRLSANDVVALARLGEGMAAAPLDADFFAKAKASRSANARKAGK